MDEAMLQGAAAYEGLMAMARVIGARERARQAREPRDAPRPDTDQTGDLCAS